MPADPILARLDEMLMPFPLPPACREMQMALRAVLALHVRTDRSFTIETGPNYGRRVARFECATCPDEDDFYSGSGAAWPCATVRTIAEALGVDP